MTAVVVCGLAGQTPVAGMGLHYLQYCLGLRDLGVDVLYLEDVDIWPSHPYEGPHDETAAYTIAWLRKMFDHFDLDWAYRDPLGQYHGTPEREVHLRCAAADLLLNVSSGQALQPHHRAADVCAVVDTDSVFTQAVYDTNAQLRETWANHDLMFTFAQLIGQPGCRVPEAGFTWKPTRQPVYLPFWEEVPATPGAVYTTVMNWNAYGTVECDGEVWGQKSVEFPLIQQLPSLTGLAFEVGLGNAPEDVEASLEADGWRVVDPRVPTETIWTFRDYIATSRGEVTVNKQAFVRSRSGWFPERSANYLAAGRPAVVEDTGWSEHIPCDGGLFAFTTTDEAVAALEVIEADPAGQGRAAREAARTHFDSAKVLSKLLADAGID